MRLKLDENLGRAAAEQLRAAGHDVHTVWDEGIAGIADAELLRVAVAEGRALLSQDLHFADLRRFAPGATHGIIVLRLGQGGPASVGGALARLLTKLPDAPLEGRLWIVSDDSIRIRSDLDIP